MAKGKRAVVLSDPRLRANRLEFDPPEGAVLKAIRSGRVRVPFGLPRRLCLDATVLVHSLGTDDERIVAQDTDGVESQLFPPYATQVQISFGGRKYACELFLVDRDRDLAECAKLL